MTHNLSYDPPDPPGVEGEATLKILNALYEGVIIQDEKGMITWANEAAQNLLGMNSHALTGRDLYDMLIRDLQARSSQWRPGQDLFREVLNNGGSHQKLKLSVSRKGQAPAWLSFNIRPLYNDRREKVTGVISSFRDISDVMKDHEEVQLLSLVAKNTPHAVIITDTDNLITWVNEAFGEMTGYTPEEVMGRSPGQILQGPETQLQLVQYMSEKRRKGQPFVCELVNYKKDGTSFWMHVQAQPILDDSGSLVNYLGIGTDISYQKKMNERLVQHNIEVQKEISRAILQAQETERGQIGRELHDNVNQMLASINLYLGYMQEEGSFETEVIESCRRCLKETIEEIRRMTRHLVVPVSKSICLKESLGALILSLGEACPIKFFLNLWDWDESMLTQSCRQNIFRIVQEQCNNIIKYSDAVTATIDLSTVPGSTNLVIADDGQGFDVITCRKGSGLINIQHRAEAFNGSVEIVSSPGRGCVLKVSLPKEISLQ